MSTSPQSPTAKAKRLRMFAILGTVMGVAAVAYGAYWYFVASRYESTEDAYAKADMAQVTPAVGGIVKQVLVEDTQPVRAGDILVTLDETDAQLALNRADAALASAQAVLSRAEAELKRRQALAGSGAISTEELSNTQSSYLSAQADVASAQAAKNQAEVDVSRTVIRSPLSGVVARRQVQVGQHVQPGMMLMSVVPLEQVYVDANFKEVQLRNVHIGQAAEVRADLYGNSVVYHGKVVGLSGGTGAAFALIPAQNATGNWIKVVQRLPVRIQLNPADLQRHPLQVGLSMHVTVDTASR